MHAAVLKVQAEVCLHGGERLYSRSRETVSRFEQIRAKLLRQETADFQITFAFEASTGNLDIRRKYLFLLRMLPVLAHLFQKHHSRMSQYEI